MINLSNSTTTVIQKFLPRILSFAKDNDIIYTIEPQHLAQASQDFGHLVSGTPVAILKPGSLEQVIAIVQEANHRGFSLTPRGHGLSQSGQSISPQGITLDLSLFRDISSDRDPSQVKCGASVTWRQLITYSSAIGYLPFVTPLNLDLTITGTLSAGGIGASSFRFGPALDHVIELEVVTGRGDYVICSTSQYSHIFNSALGGLGRNSIIISAKLKLRPFKPKVTTHYLLYSDLKQLLKDQQLLSTQSNAVYAEGFCTSSIHGLHLTPEGRRPLLHWQYGLHVGLEFDSPPRSNSEELLSSLNFQKVLLIEETETLEFISRYDIRFQQMQLTKAWQQAHPWFECFLPLDTALELIPQFLQELPPYFGDGHRIIYLPKSASSSLLMQPSSSAIVAFAILPTGIPSEYLPHALNLLETFNAKLIQHSGKRYLSGWLGPMKHQDWKQHFGNRYQEWQASKTTFDPNNILQSCLFDRQ